VMMDACRRHREVPKMAEVSDSGGAATMHDWRPAVSRVLLSPPDVGSLEEEFVIRALRTGWVAPAGPDLDAFEREAAERVGVRHAVGLSSGTAALHLALVSWGVGPGDVVPVSTLTFAATLNAVRYVGAEPFFVDCDESTGNMSPELLARSLAILGSAGRRVPVVIPVDLFGKCADYDGISEVAESAGSKLLCDAAESFGAGRGGRPAGSFGDASILSFNGNKVMTTSGGGMLLTQDRSLADHVRKLANQAREPVPHYEHTEVGFNYRLSNVLAALGRAQLLRLDEMIERRRQWRARYRTLVASTPGIGVLGEPSDAEDNCWLTALIIDPDAAGFTAVDLGAFLAQAEIETRPFWKPMHQQPVFRSARAVLDGSADLLFARGLTLPSGSAMSDGDFSRVEGAIEAWLTSR
jgi:dTDP-4-amino-4,6-dideoxygalactose transaminase